MNTTVTATGMQVQAKAEAGLIIANAADGTYNVSASSVKSTAAQLYPGSTSDLVNWFHSTSTNPAVANNEQEYSAGTAWTANSGTFGNYIVHDFYIKSSSTETLTVTALNVKSVEAKVGDAAAAQELSKALRVGILIEGDETGSTQNVYIYAPVAGYSSSYTVTNQTGAYDNGTGKRTTVAPKAGTTLTASAVTSIPGSTGTPINVQIFVWFEGEDSSCISNNIQAALETLTVTVEFSYT